MKVPHISAIAAAVAGGAILIAAGVAAAWIGSLGPAPLRDRLEFSTAVVDRDGRLLRPYATSEGRWRLPARADGVYPRYLALLAAIGVEMIPAQRLIEHLIALVAAVSGLVGILAALWQGGHRLEYKRPPSPAP